MNNHRHAPVSTSRARLTRPQLRSLTRFLSVGAPAVGTTFVASSAAALITAVGLMAVYVNPPPSVKPGASISPDIIAFDEQQDVETHVDIPLDTGPGTVVSSPDDVRPFVIPRGTCLSSHYVHYQPPTTSSATGRVRFNRPILGVALLQASLDATNFLGAPGTDYPVAPQCSGAGVDCGMELPQDVLTVGVSAVEVDFTALNPGDRIRVVTKGNPSRCRPLCLEDECSSGGHD